jgi:hypothetical protein
MLESLTPLQILWIGTAAFAAYVIRGMSGFGAGLILAPLLALVLPVHVVVPLSGLLVFVLFIYLTIRDRHDVIWRELKLLALPTIAGVLAGLFLFRTLDNRLLLIMLGCFLIVYATYMLAVHAFGLPQFRCSERWALPVGFSGSFVDTLFGGGGGTLIVIYMHARGIGRVQFRATVATLWFIEMDRADFGLCGGRLLHPRGADHGRRTPPRDGGSDVARRAPRQPRQPRNVSAHTRSAADGERDRLAGEVLTVRLLPALIGCLNFQLECSG